MTNTKQLRTVRAALNHVFGHRVSPAEVEDSTFTASDDPGGWAPRSRVVIHTERGIPPFSYDSSALIAAWDRVGDILMADGLYCEPINGAVVAVYDA